MSLIGKDEARLLELAKEGALFLSLLATACILIASSRGLLIVEHELNGSLVAHGKIGQEAEVKK